MVVVNSEIRIPLHEFEFSYVRSSGPGGQNVNKVNSKAVLRWNLLQSESLTEDMRNRLLLKLASRLTTDGDLVIMSDRYRDQPRNREDSIDKFREVIAAAAAKPKPRKKTKQSYSSTQRAKKSQGKHSEKKSMRKSVKYD
jgi:ribosome-associated protein